MLRSFIILLPCLCCLFWIIALGHSWRTNNRPCNYWIAAALLLASCIYLWSIHFADANNYRILFKLDKIEGIPVLLLLPVLYYCFKSATGEQPFTWKDFLWLLPSLLVVGSMVISYSIMGKQLAAEYIRDIIRHQGIITSFHDPLHQRHYLISGRIYAILVLLQITYLLTAVTIHLIRHSTPDKNHPHHTRNHSPHYHYGLSFGIHFALFLSLATFQQRPTSITNPLLIQLILGIWIIVICFIKAQTNNLTSSPRLLSLSHIATRETAAHKGRTKQAAPTGTSLKISRKLLNHLNHLIDEEQIFLQHDLRLEDLARLMNTNRTYISRLINKEFHCSFSDLINSKRILHAQKLMQENHDMTQEQIAECSGFQRATSFGRAFKQQAGITFREWQQNNNRRQYLANPQKPSKRNR